MFGTKASMPNFALPLTFSGMSRRGVQRPTTRYSDGFLSVIFLRSSSLKVFVIGTRLTISP